MMSYLWSSFWVDRFWNCSCCTRLPPRNNCSTVLFLGHTYVLNSYSMSFVAWAVWCMGRWNKHFVQYFSIIEGIHVFHVGVLHSSIEFSCCVLANSLNHAFFLSWFFCKSELFWAVVYFLQTAIARKYVYITFAVVVKGM